MGCRAGGRVRRARSSSASSGASGAPRRSRPTARCRPRRSARTWPRCRRRSRRGPTRRPWGTRGSGPPR
ncbi:hypothetical protein FTX61_03790 [Nitriliruptoraceae bacterium ZYF776]|nr:hypothetical protein [Profundirhabdus halotolerans]